MYFPLFKRNVWGRLFRRNRDLSFSAGRRRADHSGVPVFRQIYEGHCIPNMAATQTGEKEI